MKYEWKKGDILRVVDYGSYPELCKDMLVTAEEEINTNDGDEYCQIILPNGRGGIKFYVSRFEKVVDGKKTKPLVVDKHVVVQDSCGNFLGFRDSYKEAEDLAKSNLNNVTIYKMVEVAKVTSERRVKKVKTPTIKKRR
jgi:hypothetical protein